MNLDKILTIPGKSGLYQLKAKTRSGFLIESLFDGKKQNVGLQNNVSILSKISIYTHQGEKPLAQVFEAIANKENNQQILSHKEDKQTLETYFTEIIPDYDPERVYLSDIKKIISWYNLLIDKGLISKELED